MIHSITSYLPDCVTGAYRLILIIRGTRDSISANVRASAGFNHLLYVLISNDEYHVNTVFF